MKSALKAKKHRYTPSSIVRSSEIVAVRDADGLAPKNQRKRNRIVPGVKLG